MDSYLVSFWNAAAGRFHYRVVWAADDIEVRDYVRTLMRPPHWRLRSIRQRDNGEVVFMDDALPSLPPARNSPQNRTPVPGF